MRHAFTAALLATTIWSLPGEARAQAMSAEEAAALRAELAALKAKVETLEARLDAAAPQPETGASVPGERPAIASAPPAPPAPTTAPATEVNWKGAPEIRTASGWSFKPRGRMQVDAGGFFAPDGVAKGDGGLRPEFRRVYLGVDGKIPGGFAYRVEADFAKNSVELTDVYLSYGTGPLTVTAGQVKPFWSLEDMTSDLFTSTMERAAYTQAFGFERRVGLSAQFKHKDLLLQGGVFGNNAGDLLDSTSESVSVDARAVWMPKLADTQLHLGGSIHVRDFDNPAATVRYRARPFTHATSVRLVDTGQIDAKGERGIGAEAAVIHGPFHATGEGYWQTVDRLAAPDPTYFGGYAELGMVLTRGDRRGYKDGTFDRLKPSRPLSEGGLGAIEVNARYDYLDLNDAGLVGGQQQAALVSLVWVPIDYVRITANYGKLWIDDARVATATGDRDYSVDTVGVRTQIDF